MAKFRYFALKKSDAPPSALKAVHSEFLRTGRISRRREDWLAEERRYLTHEEVAARTGRKLEAAGETAHERINTFHRSIRFPKLIFHRTLENQPHLGYCHVTSARTSFARFADVKWAFYLTNFFADIGGTEQFFERIRPDFSRMYFAVAIQPDQDSHTMAIDRSVRDNGVLFRTRDPKEALKNVLMLGARDVELRKIIAAL